MVRKIFIAMAAGLFLLASCGTMFRANNAEVKAASGSNATVQVLENGLQIYNGPLPAKFPVSAHNNYTIAFIDGNGQNRLLSVEKGFNGWVIGSIFLGLLPVIIDIATGSVMQAKPTTVLPIGLFENSFIGLAQNIPMDAGKRLLGNIYAVE